MSHGGAREGAGRKTGGENDETRRRRALKMRWLSRVEKEADRIFDAHMELALGHFREIKLPTGEVRVYKKSPDGGSLRWLQEHIWGLAPLKLDLDARVSVEHSLSDAAQAQIKQAIAYALPAKLRQPTVIDGDTIDIDPEAESGFELPAEQDPPRPELPDRTGE